MNKVILNYLKMNLCVCIKKVDCPIKAGRELTTHGCGELSEIS